MRKIKFVILLIIIISIFIVLATCATNNPKELYPEQAVEIARPYFQELYGKNIIVENVRYEVVGMIGRYHLYRNIITVSEGEAEYKLILDKRNVPVSDNISAIETIKNIEISSLEEKLKPLGLKLHEHYDLEVAASPRNLQYSVCLSVVAEDCPSREQKDRIYSLLGVLKDNGVDYFIINIDTPDFLFPKMKFGYGVYGLRLAGVGFSTDMDMASFKERYNNYVNQIYWDKQKFDEKIFELTQLGYENATFFISRWTDGDTIEIVLYCESGKNISDEAAIALLEEMDDSYFRIGDNKIKYTLQHRLVDKKSDVKGVN